MGPRGSLPTHGGVATVKLEDRIVERAAAILVSRLLEDDARPDAPTRGRPETSPVVPGKSGPKPMVDGDGDFHCPDHPDKVFVTLKAFRWHRSRVHGEKGGRP